MAVKPFQEVTLAGAIQRAKDCETTLKHGQQKLMAYSMQKDNTTIKLLNVVNALTQQIANMEQRLAAGNAATPVATPPNVPPVANNPNTVVRRNPPTGRPITCYTCGQPGHISRRCPTNPNANQTIPPIIQPQGTTPKNNNTVTIDAAALQQLINKVNSGPTTNNNVSLN